MRLQSSSAILLVFVLFKLILSVTALPFPQGESDSCITRDNQTGTCISILNCPDLLHLLTSAPRPVPLEIKTSLKQVHCGYDNGQPKVCCSVAMITATPPVTDPTGVNPPVTGESTFPPPPPDVTNHPNLNLLPSSCGTVDDDRILRGNKTNIYEFPWMALISYNTRGEIGFKCGGTIINTRYILTAAHCLTNLIPGRTILGVRVGEHDIRTEQDCETVARRKYCAPTYQDMGVDEILTHLGYSPTRLVDDIGLIRLASDIDFTKLNTAPICLPITRDVAKTVLEGEELTVAGWGFTETGLTSPDLLKADLPVSTNQFCGSVHNNSIPGGVGYKQVCAGGVGGVDSCLGDSGGPLKHLIQVGATLRFVQYGIVSYGPRPCGVSGRPGVYTRTAYYMDWILDNLRL